jgi:hypothetical protein
MSLTHRTITSAFFQHEDRDLTALLIILAITIFVVTPLATTAWAGRELMSVMFALITIVGVAAVSDTPVGVWLTALVALVSIGLDYGARVDPSRALVTIDLAVRLAFTLLLGLVVTFRVFRSGNVSHHRIQGAIVVYLLTGLAWGYMYEIIAVIDTTAFQLAGGHDEPMIRMGLFRYFSFVTVTSLGYGDILPVSPIARSLTTLEALFGQLYPAIVVARLVTLELSHRLARSAETP